MIFTPVTHDNKITHLNSFKVSQAVEKLYPECILEVRYTFCLYLIAGDTRKGMTTKTLLNSDISTKQLSQHLRPVARLVKVHRLGKGSLVELTFHGNLYEKQPE